MSNWNQEGFVIKRYPLGENDRIIVFYTRERGKIRAVAQGALKARSRFTGRLEPFSLLDMDVYCKESGTLSRINQITVRHKYSHISTDLKQMSAGFEILGILDQFTPDEEPDEQLFDCVLEIFSLIETTNIDAEFWLRAFELRFFQISGFGLQLDVCVQCSKARKGKAAYFSVGKGGIVCSKCQEGEELTLLLTGSMIRMVELCKNGHFSKFNLNPDQIERFVNETRPLALNVFLHHFGILPTTKKLMNSL